MQRFLTDYGIASSLTLGAVGLAGAIYLIRMVNSCSEGNDRMAEIAGAIQAGAKAYLRRQVVTISVIAAILFFAIGYLRDWITALGFLLGAVCSLAAGYIGMMIAVRANVRTAQAASESKHAALRIAFNGGAVTGLLVVALGLLSVGLFYRVVLEFTGENRIAINSLVGLALGSSLISVFARLGGGIYTKAADVGADLVGKIEQNLQEDDPRNPATIADNVGDNVGDCAGMAADVFETYAVSLIGAVLVAFLTASESTQHVALVFPFVICGVSIIGALLGIGFVNIVRLSPTRALVGGVAISGIVSGALLKPVTESMFPQAVEFSGKPVEAPALFACVLVGIAMTFAAVIITNYFTSTAHRPVRRIAEACNTGHATNIIAGISTGHHATLPPVLCIAASIWLCHSQAGLYGIAIAVVSMLSLSGIIISLDAFGPITDNAGGIAVMSGLDPSVRKITDELDAVGNTMKAVTKGYAIASAGLAAMVLFGSYVEELKAHLHTDFVFDLMDPRVMIGLFIGGLLPFSFTAYAMDAVGNAAGAVVREVRRQIAAFPGILTGKDTPDYRQCVDIVTKAALRQMILPALLPLIFVVGVAIIPDDGPYYLGGVLVGTIVTGLFIGIAMTSAGGAWDNAKKFVEDGNHGGKGSPAHAASVTGDTVGDPYKDTAGPAVNPMIKVVNILAILLIPILFR